jgi:ABC-type branched-subunit amino acid transport system ATPase component
MRWPSGVRSTSRSRAASASGTEDRAGADLLDVSHLGVTYEHGARGLEDLSLRVKRGEIVAILGRNGAGKTSTVRAIGGFLRSEHVTVSGNIEFAGRSMAGSLPMEAFRQGIVTVQERDKVFPALKVSEHLQLVSRKRSDASTKCEFQALDRLRTSKAGLLSGGERQMLALEVAWRCSPRLLLVDELSLGLAPGIVRTLMERLRRLARDNNVGMIVVEQDADAALRVADRVYVLSNGVVAWHGVASDTAPAELASKYLGTSR